MYKWIKIPLGILLALGTTSALSADESVEIYDSYKVSIGPEFYRFCREREGGTSQSGYMWGGRLELERKKPWAFYAGISALYARGVLNGGSIDSITEDHNRLRSHVTDGDIEGRVGFNFQTCSQRVFSFTPFLGGGYFREMHRYVSPSPLTIHFCNSFSYACGGFLSTFDLTPSWEIGLNFKVRYMVDAKNKITHDPDPEVDDITIGIGNRFHYRAELPINYYFSSCEYPLEASIIPFYEFRHYGEQPNFPFDFLETKIKLYGVTGSIAYWF